MNGEPEPVETEQKVGTDGGNKVDGGAPPPTESIDVNPVVGKEGGETAFRRKE